MRKFTFQDIELNYKIKGAGKPLLFLHGFLENHKMWDKVIDDFSNDEYTCLVIDLPCHGESRFKGHKCSMKSMANAIDALLISLKIKVEFYIGHSMGGYVALELNTLRSAHIILLHSNFWADSKAKRQDRNRVIEIVSQNKDLFIKEAIPNLFAEENKINCEENIQEIISGAIELPINEIQAATAGMRDRSAFYQFEETQRLSIIQGEKDPIIPMQKMIEEVTLLNIRHELIELKDVGHMSIWEAQGLLIKSLKSIISQ